MTAGREAFNRGEFYEAHEFWEEVWNEIDDPERTWVQGMIQIATGLHKLTRDRADVCQTLLERALSKLEGSRPVLDGIDVASARSDAGALLAALRRGERPDARSVGLKVV